MRAIVFERHGDPEVLELRDVPEPAIRPVVDSVLPLAGARRAHQRIEARQMFGKVVLVP